MKRILSSLLALPAFVIFTGCEAKIETSSPPVVEKKETTIVNPPAVEKKVEKNTTIINPPAEKKE